MAIDIFQERALQMALEEMFPPKTFLRDTFFSTTELSETEHVDIPVFTGKRRLAPFVNKESNAVSMDKTGWDVKTFKPGYIKVKMNVLAQDIFRRQFSGFIYPNDINVAQRVGDQMRKNLIEMQEAITRTEEYLCAQVLCTGKVPYLSDEVDQEIDFGQPAGNRPVLAGGDLWTAGTSDPIKDLLGWDRDLIAKITGQVSDVAILGQDVVKPFLDHQDVRDLLDNRRIEMGQIDPRTLPNGAKFLGTLKNPVLDIYSYDEWYLDSGSVLQPMVPVDKVILGSTRARTAMHYGQIFSLTSPGPTRFHVRTIDERNADTERMWVLVESAPVPAMYQASAFVCAQVI